MTPHVASPDHTLSRLVALMRAGDLRARIGFYKRDTVGVDSPPSPDYGAGETEFAGDAEFTCSANIKPRLGGESVLASRLTGVNLVNITVRQSSMTRLVDTGWRAKDERSGTIYNIRSIIDPNEHDQDHGKWFEMLCEQGVAT